MTVQGIVIKVLSVSYVYVLTWHRTTEELYYGPTGVRMFTIVTQGY